LETPKKLIDELLDGLELSGKRVLEPSCGSGAIAAELKKRGADVTGFELNRMLFDEFRKIGEITGINGDFLRSQPVACFDYVVAVPPYKDNIDCVHIMHMYGFLRQGGMIRSLTLPYWASGTFVIQRNFRNWLNDKSYKLKFIEDESYANCPKALIQIVKR
jgi:SAM-dependent methyltransferase